jgi:hypothetical protein
MGILFWLFSSRQVGNSLSEYAVARRDHVTVLTEPRFLCVGLQVGKHVVTYMSAAVHHYITCIDLQYLAHFQVHLWTLRVGSANLFAQSFNPIPAERIMRGKSTPGLSSRRDIFTFHRVG